MCKIPFELVSMLSVRTKSLLISQTLRLSVPAVKRKSYLWKTTEDMGIVSLLVHPRREKIGVV